MRAILYEGLSKMHRGHHAIEILSKSDYDKLTIFLRYNVVGDLLERFEPLTVEVQGGAIYLTYLFQRPSKAWGTFGTQKGTNQSGESVVEGFINLVGLGAWVADEFFSNPPEKSWELTCPAS